MAGALLLQHPYRSKTVLAYSATEAQYDDVSYVNLSDSTRNSRVLVLGGTGRVGESTVTALSNLCPNLKIVIGGRNREKGEAMVAKLGHNFKFAQLDINDSNMLHTNLKGIDLVFHIAGPFQQDLDEYTVLEAAINTKTAYVDVCDNTNYAIRAKSLQSKAVSANVSALITAGLCPGLSNVIAAELVDATRNEGKRKPEKLRFYYCTAGSGGAGPAMLATSFLLLAEEVTAYNNGKKIKLKPYTRKLNVDFGKGIGNKNVYLMNLPEVRTTHEILQVPTVSAHFGSDPFIWNWGMKAMTQLLSPEALNDRTKVQQMVELLHPVIRSMDAISGERFSMRVDLERSDGQTRYGIYTHNKLSTAVGVSTAAFVVAVLEGSTQPGVWFPEEPQGIAVEAREALLKRASQGTFNFILNK